MAEPLTTADQHDTARALVQATHTARDCKARMDALIDAVEVRDEIVRQLKEQMK